MQLCRESLTRRSDCFTDQEVPASELRSHQSGRKGENWTKRSAACRNRIDDFKVSQKLNSNSIEFQAIRKWAVGGYLEAAITRMERGSLRCSLVFLHIRNWKRIGCLPASSEPTSALCTDSAVGKRRKKKRIHAPQLANFDVDALDAKEGGLHVESPEFWRGKLEGSLDITLSLYFFFPPLRFFVQHSVRTESNFQSGLSLSAESRKRKSRPAAATGRMSTCGSASMPCQVTWAPDIKRYAAGAPFRHH